MAVSSLSFDQTRLNIIQFLENNFNNKNIDLSKSAFTSSIIDIISDGISDSIYFQNYNFDEKFLSTSRDVNNIIKFTRTFGYDVKFSNPASCNISLILEIDKNFTGLQELLINSNTNYFMINNLKYVLPGDIRIIQRSTNSINQVDDFYAILENENNFKSKYKHNLLPKIYSETIDGVNRKFLILLIDIKQIEKENYQLDYYKNLEKKNKINISITKQLADLKVYFFVGNEKVYLKNFYEKTDSVDLTNSFYKIDFISLQDFTISFVNDINFKEIEDGTKIFIDLETTEGSLGNLKKPNFQFNKSAEFSNLNIFSIATSDSVNGSDFNDIDKIKRSFISFVQTNEVLVTENDFLRIIQEKLNLDEKSFFLLRKNDLVERVMDLFFLVKDENDNLIKTNNITISIPKEDLTIFFNENNGCLSPFQKIKSVLFNDGCNTNIMVNKNYKQNHLSLNEKKVYFFSNYYLIKVFKEPYLKVSLFDLSCNNDYIFDLVYYNSNYLTQTLNSIDYMKSMLGLDYLKCKRNIFNKNNVYNFSAKLNSSNENFINKQFSIIVYFDNSSQNIEDFFLKLNPSDSINGLFEVNLTTNDMINDNENLLVDNVYKRSAMNVTIDGKESWVNFYGDFTEFSNNSNVHIFVVRKTVSETLKDPLLDKIDILSNYELLLKYKVSELSIFENIDYLCKSNLNYSQSGDLQISNLSLIEYNTLNPEESSSSNENIQVALYNTFKTYKEIFKFLNEDKNFDLNVNFRFFNTHNFIKQFSIDENLIKIELEYSTINNMVLTSIELEEIKSVIIQYISNRIFDKLDKNIYLSEIIRIVYEINKNVIQLRLMNLKENIYYKFPYNLSKLNKSEYENYFPEILYTNIDSIILIQKFI